MTARRLVGIALTLILVLAIVLHAADILSHFALDMIFVAGAAWTVLCLLAGRHMVLGLAAAAALLVAVLLVALKLQQSELRYMPYLAIAPANFVLAYIFARGLVGDREPVLLQLIRMMGRQSTDDPAFRRFVARQCLLWSAMTLATALLALACVIATGARPVLATALITLALVQIVWFAASHHYATLRYGRPETWILTLRTMIRPETWRSLTV